MIAFNENTKIGKKFNERMAQKSKPGCYYVITTPVPTVKSAEIKVILAHGMSFDPSSTSINITKLKYGLAMTLVKVNNNGHKSLSSFVDEFFQGFPAGYGRDASFGFPPVNIHETAEAYHLELSAPGRNKEDFK